MSAFVCQPVNAMCSAGKGTSRSTSPVIAVFAVLVCLVTSVASQSLLSSLPFHTASGLASQSQHASRILSLSMSSTLREGITKESCRHIVGLSFNQRRWCKTNYELLAAVGDGTKLGLKECQRRFAKRHWNCPITQPTVFSKVLGAASKETAFVHSIQSAGITLAIARACSRGEATSRCGCASAGDMGEARGNWTWGTCSDNVAEGARYGREFLNAREDGRSPASLMSLHDTEAGRKVVGNNMVLVCKCHGLTGTCAHRTCWYSLPKLNAVGSRLLKKYDRSVQVRILPVGPKLITTGPSSKLPEADDLVHLRSSPDYCAANSRAGSLGTTGRQCSRKATNKGGTVKQNACDTLCCGRGYSVHRNVTVEKCSCKFVWCCSVKCKECRVAKQTYTCR